MARTASRDRVQRHREALRKRGLRPIQLWVPDTRAPGFAEEAQRQCRAINAAEETARTIDWVESVSVFDEDDAAGDNAAR